MPKAKRKTRRNVTPKPIPTLQAEPDPNPQERFRLYRLCTCFACLGTGKANDARCTECRGEGKVRERVATAATPEGVGLALITCAREGEFEDCPFGLLDTMGETGKKWLILPWQPSVRNISDAARVLARARKGEADG